MLPSMPLLNPRGRTIQLLNVAEASITKLELPFAVSSVHPLSESQYLLVRCGVTPPIISWRHSFIKTIHPGSWKKELNRSQNFMP